MTIQECYKNGQGFEGVQRRFGGVKNMVEKFAIKFLSDSSFRDLWRDGLKERMRRKAHFRAAHTLKESV